MRIERNRVVALEYTVTDADGKVIDTNRGGESLYYLHGHHNIVPGLERALEGKVAGEELEVQVDPSDGYGERDEALVFEVPRSELPAGIALQRGTQLQVTASNGHRAIATITKVKLNSVVLDANHELAGQRLHFSVRVQQVRQATREELAHGHAHGPGHHH